MTTTNIIGVIGGMGPYAGIDLVKKIFDETAARTDQEHLPVALLSYPEHISDRTDYMLDGTGSDPAVPIAAIALELERLGAAVAGMSCNSAHAPPIFDAVGRRLNESHSTIKILNMVEEVVRFLKDERPGMQRVGMLSTNSVFHLGVYRRALAEAGFEVVAPDRSMQERLVHPAIYDPTYGIKAQSNPIHPGVYENLRTVTRTFREQSVDAIVLGCTELPLAIPGRSFDGMAVIDPTRILARALIRETHPERLKRVDPAGARSKQIYD